MPGIRKTMDEYKAGKLHSGSKSGPKVKSRAQAIAIGLSEERQKGSKMPKMPKKPGSAMKPATNPAAPAVISAATVPAWKNTGAAPKSHGYGHDAIQRQGKLRMSGHSGAHRIGGRKK